MRMRTSISKAAGNLLLGSMLSLLAFCPSQAQAQLFFNAEAVFLSRDHDGGSTIATSGAQDISSNPGSFSTEPGYRLSIGGIFDTWQVEGTFTQLNPWTADLDGTFGSNIPFASNMDFNGFLKLASEAEDGGEFLGPGEYDAHTRSNYKDAEIMFGSSYAHRRWRIGMGYRYVQLDEQNGLFMSGVFDDAPLVGLPDGLSDAALMNAGAELVAGGANGLTNGTDLDYLLQSATSNQMSGFQTAFGVQLLDGKWITIEGLAKVGIYYNRMTGQVTETVGDSGPDASVYQRILSGNKTGAAFVGNLGLRGVVGITDYIDLVGGGEVLFLSGVALGNDQYQGVSQTMVGTNAYTVQNKGSVIAYGGNIGLRIYW